MPWGCVSPGGKGTRTGEEQEGAEQELTPAVASGSWVVASVHSYSASHLFKSPLFNSAALGTYSNTRICEFAIKPQQPLATGLTGLHVASTQPSAHSLTHESQDRVTCRGSLQGRVCPWVEREPPWTRMAARRPSVQGGHPP